MASSSALSLQPRDLELLRGLFESRLMTLRHIAAIHFDGKAEMAKKRVQKLKAALLIGAQERHVNEPATLYLTRKGFNLLADYGLLSGFPEVSAVQFMKRAQVSALTRRHELDILDVKAAFATALRNSEDFSLSTFSTWPALHRFTASIPGNREREIFPDGFIHVQRRDGTTEFFFFLEVDRSSETLGILANKAACYLEFYRSGGFAERMGGRKNEIEKFPFRILFVCKTEERRDNVARAMLNLRTPIYRQAWLATIEEVLTTPFAAVWICPAHRAVTKQSATQPLCLFTQDTHEHSMSTAKGIKI